MKAVVLAGGDLSWHPRLERVTEGAELVLAADSGLRHAAMTSLEPAAVVGDLDSVSEAVLARYPRLPRREYPQRKDELDLELAISIALEAGAGEVVVLGAFGSRLDQSLAALLAGARLRSERGVVVSLHDGDRDAYPLVAGDSLAPNLPDGTIFSLLAIESAICSVAGAEYPLERSLLERGVGLGVSNRASGGPRVQVHAGLVVLIVEWRA